MEGKVLLDSDDFITLRIESREALHRLGVASNPGFTNANIIEGLARALGSEVTMPDEMEHFEFSGEMFRDSLGEILGLEIPPLVDELVVKLKEVTN